MSGTLTPDPWQTFFDPSSGVPLAGGKLYVYASGTDVPATVYQDAALTVPHEFPITLDAAGRVTIYLPADGTFKYVLKTAAGITVRTQDPITSVALSPELVDALTNIREALVSFAGSDAAALMGTTVPAGTTKTARASGTGFFSVAAQVIVNFEATLWAEAGATATVGIYPVGASETPVTGSVLTSTNPDGELVVTPVPVTLTAGTYLVKGHSAHATKQAWGVAYRVVPTE